MNKIKSIKSKCCGAETKVIGKIFSYSICTYCKKPCIRKEIMNG